VTTEIDQTALAEPLNLSEISDAAIAVIDEQGTVAGWTRAAERLVGHSAKDAVGRSAAVVLSPSQDALRVSASAEQRRAQGGWSGTVARGTTSPPSHSRGNIPTELRSRSR
jgi:PAS domain S-box-containing protein